MYMAYTIQYGTNDQLSTIYSPSNIINNLFTVNGSAIVDTSFELVLNYSLDPSVYVTYTITAIQIE